jgi:hypothetical protein
MDWVFDGTAVAVLIASVGAGLFVVAWYLYGR